MEHKARIPRKIPLLRAYCALHFVRYTEIARRLGYSTAYVSGVLTGRKAVSWHQLERIRDTIAEIIHDPVAT